MLSYLQEQTMVNCCLKKRSRSVPLFHLYSGRRTSLSLILVGARVAQFLVFCVIFVQPLFVFLSFVI
jgi:hypothetical protein